MNFSALPQRRKGFGLLEVILVFAIVIGAAAVVFGVFLPAQQAAAADHDRTMANTIAANTFQLFRPGSPVSGAAIVTAFGQSPTQFAPGFCTMDPSTNFAGCLSALSGSPVNNVMETDTVASDGSETLQSIGIRFQDLTVGQCQALLAGGTEAAGMSGVETNTIATNTPLSDETAVISFCTTAADGGDTIDALYAMYQPSTPSDSVDASPPTTGPVIPPDELPSLPPGWTPPWN